MQICHNIMIKLYYIIDKQLDGFQLQHYPVCYQYLPVGAGVVDVDEEVTIEDGDVGSVDPPWKLVCDIDWVGVVEVGSE